MRHVNAQLLGDTVYCETMKFATVNPSANISVAFGVIWDGSKPLDNPENIHGTLTRERVLVLSGR